MSLFLLTTGGFYGIFEVIMEDDQLIRSTTLYPSLSHPRTYNHFYNFSKGVKK